MGFIALFGVAVLNGILMINHFNDLRKRNKYYMCTNRIIAKGCPHLLRPVFLTGAGRFPGICADGDCPVGRSRSAASAGDGGIGGLIVSTVLTLLLSRSFTGW